MKLDKDTRNQIRDLIEENGKVLTDDVVGLVARKMNFDPEKARLTEARRITSQIMSRIKDDEGTRACFSIKDDDVSRYVHVDKTKNIKWLDMVGAKIDQMTYGLTKSKKKIDLRKREIKDQTELEEFEGHDTVTVYL